MVLLKTLLKDNKLQFPKQLIMEESKKTPIRNRMIITIFIEFFTYQPYLFV